MLEGGLLAFYLASSAVSAKSTQFSLGSQQSSPDAWSELSRPPHFVAYRGVYSRPVHVGYFPALKPIGIQLSSKSTDPVARWSYRRTAQQLSAKTTETSLEVVGEDWVFTTGSFHQHTKRSGDAFMTTALAVDDGAESLTLTFAPPLPDLTSMESGDVQSTWRLAMAGNDDLMTGEIALKRTGRAIEVRLQPRSPAWTRQVALHADIELTYAGNTYQAHTVFPKP